MTTNRVVMTAVLASLLFVSVPVFASETDDSIEASAKQSYVFKTYLKGDDVKIQSKDGVVTLSGTVNEEFHKSLAQETAQDTPGVTSVDNRLELKAEYPAEKSLDLGTLRKVKTCPKFYQYYPCRVGDIFLLYQVFRS